MRNKSKLEMLETLRGMVRDALRLRSEGSTYARLARASGLIDGYMRVLLESGMVEARELLEIVAHERAAFDGPALGPVASETGELAA
jgi:hypothetical protein